MAINYDHYFGACPQCGETDGYVNVGRSHWFYCAKHMTCWFIGANLFSSWQNETEADWQAAAEMLEAYEEVEPVPQGMESDSRSVEELLAESDAMKLLNVPRRFR